jgi:competence protein ComEA
MRGAGLILLLFLSAGIYHYSRWALPEREELPAVLCLQPQLTTVAVADSGGSYGLYQFNDASKLIDVIKLTAGIPDARLLQEKLRNQPVLSGEILKVIRIEGKYFQIERSWLSARHRILLQIPLHPDRMTLLDWETLPGIGPKLAATIESDRQKNGDFIEFAGLKRVKGIGSKKLEAWMEYFQGKMTGRKINNPAKTDD